MQEDWAAALTDVADMLLEADLSLTPELREKLEELGLKTEALPSRVRDLFSSTAYIIAKLFNRPDEGKQLALAWRVLFFSVLATSRMYELERK